MQVVTLRTDYGVMQVPSDIAEWMLPFDHQFERRPEIARWIDAQNERARAAFKAGVDLPEVDRTGLTN